MDSYGNLILSCSNLLKIKEMLKTKLKFLLFRPSSGFHFKIFFRSAAPLLRPSPVGAIRCRVSQGIVSQPRRSSPHRPVDWRLWEIKYVRPFFDLIYSFKLPETDFCSLFFQWWFQNHLRRALNLDLYEPRVPFVKQFANIVEHCLTFLLDPNKVIKSIERE